MAPADLGSAKRALIIAPGEPSGVVDALAHLLEKANGYSVAVIVRARSESLRSAFERPEEAPALVLLEVSEADSERVDTILASLARHGGAAPVLLIVGREVDPDRLQTWLRCGASDFLALPLRDSLVDSRIEHLTRQLGEGEEAVGRLQQKLGLARLVGRSPAFVAEVRKIPLISRSDASVLIQGETGTGKEVIARCIHYLSFRSGGPFVPVSCAGIPTELVENELFGHVKGAFTGASINQKGLIADADGGTLLLDDVDCLAAAVQAKLLRFLQEKEYRRLGSPTLYHADVRVLSSSNANLAQALDQGSFRLDLFHHLNVIPINLPPLRRRPEDIPLLANHFLCEYADDLELPPPRVPARVMDHLLGYDWPGNVRELKHVIERALILSQGGPLAVEHLMLPATASKACLCFQDAKARVVRRFEKRYIERQLVAHHGNITRAAQASGKNRRAFFELMRKHDIDVTRFRRPRP